MPRREILREVCVTYCNIPEIVCCNICTECEVLQKHAKQGNITARVLPSNIIRKIVF